MTTPATPAFQPYTSRTILRNGLCPCDCGGGIGFRPLFHHEPVADDKGRVTFRQTTEYRPDPISGRPMARMVILCRNDAPAIMADLDYRSAENAWRSDRKAAKLIPGPDSPSKDAAPPAPEPDA